MYRKCKTLENEVTNKQIEFMLINDDILSGELEPNEEAYRREYGLIMEQSEVACAYLEENLGTLKQCLWEIEKMENILDRGQEDDEDSPISLEDSSEEKEEQSDKGSDKDSEEETDQVGEAEREMLKQSKYQKASKAKAKAKAKAKSKSNAKSSSKTASKNQIKTQKK